MTPNVRTGEVENRFLTADFPSESLEFETFFFFLSSGPDRAGRVFVFAGFSIVKKKKINVKQNS